MTTYLGNSPEIEFLKNLDENKADKASPTFTGIPKGPTAPVDTNSTQLATTAFVQNVVTGYLRKTIPVDHTDMLIVDVDGGYLLYLTEEEAANPIIRIDGTLPGNLIVVLPNTYKRIWTIANWTNASSYTLKVALSATGAGVEIARSNRGLVYSDGVSILNALTLFSPNIQGIPTVPNATTSTNNTQIANTAFVHNLTSGHVTIALDSVGRELAIHETLPLKTITLTSDDVCNAFIRITGNIDTDVVIILPTGYTRLWGVSNETVSSTNKNLYIKHSVTGTGVSVNRNTKNLIYSSGSVIYEAFTDFYSTVLTGTPTAPTATPGTSTGQLATTAFVQNVVKGYVTKTLTGLTSPLVLTTDEAANAIIYLNGTLADNFLVEFPAGSDRLWAVLNATSGGKTLSLGRVGATTKVNVAQGKRNLVIMTSSGMYDAFNDFESIVLTGNPTAPTPAEWNNSTSIATTAFVQTTAAAVAANAVSDAAVPDATTSVAGKIMIASSGDTSSTNKAATPAMLASGLGDKSDTGHGHSISDVTGLSAALSGKSDTTHTHSGYQANLGFTPVQQGGGTGQGTNKVYIGWKTDGTLGLHVDSTNFGNNWPINITGTATPSAHSHSEYASASHGHTGYAASSHTHSGYATSNHDHSDTAYRNTKIGYNALSSVVTGSSNTAVGYGALAENVSGSWNIVIGDNALKLNSSGDHNVVIGVNACETGTGNSSNVAIGNNTLKYATDTDSCVAVGSNALYNSAFNADLNVAIGSYSLSGNTTGRGNTAIGYASGNNLSTYDYTTCIGYYSTATNSSQVQLGGPFTSTYAYGSVQDRSDIRDKADIRNTILGLEFINELRPVDFKWDYRDDYRPNMPTVPTIPKDATDEEIELIKSKYKLDLIAHAELCKHENIIKDGSKKRSRYHHGLIAQEVEELLKAKGIDFGGFQDHSINGGEDVKSIGYTELIGPLIKAVQELSQKNLELVARLESIESKLV